jgi:hypothetical protein
MEINNQDNGLITKIWGPAMWESINSIAFGYPINPSVEQKRFYKIYFLNLGNVLPCSFCQKSYNCFIAEKNTNTYLSDNVFDDRKSLIKWVYNLHNRVNIKLDVDYAITFDEFIKKYESYRAICNPKFDGCVMTPSDKIISFTNAKKTNCSIIPKHTAEYFKEYALERGIKFNLDKYDTMPKNDNKNWDKRNSECTIILKHMRHNGVSSVEQNGEHKGKPTMHELRLLARLCSSMNKTELHKLTKNMKIYKIKF